MDKRKPWLDYKGSIELARQEQVFRDKKEKIRYQRNKYVTIFLLIGSGIVGGHRFYLYDSKIGWGIMKLSHLLYFTLIFSLLIFRRSISSNIELLINIIILTVFVLFIAKELPYVLKRTEEINKDILSYD